MKPLRSLIALAALLPGLALAQWLWLDKDGRKVFSDRSPPADVPARNILKQPGGARVSAPAEAEASADVAAVASAAKATPVLPKVSGLDKTLEEKKKLAEQAEAAKKKTEDDKIARDRAESCERTKRALTAFDSGQRVRTPNAKGEMEIMGDEQRAAETKRLQGLAATNCKT
jgi:hypothetical protein